MVGGGVHALLRLVYLLRAEDSLMIAESAFYLILLFTSVHQLIYGIVVCGKCES